MMAAYFEWGSFVASFLAALAATGSAVAAWKASRAAGLLTRLEKQRRLVELIRAADELISRMITLPDDHDDIKKRYCSVNNLLRLHRPIIPERLFVVLIELRDTAEQHVEVGRRLVAGHGGKEALVEEQTQLRERS